MPPGTTFCESVIVSVVELSRGQVSDLSRLETVDLALRLVSENGFQTSADGGDNV